MLVFLQNQACIETVTQKKLRIYYTANNQKMVRVSRVTICTELIVDKTLYRKEAKTYIVHAHHARLTTVLLIN